MSTPGRTSSDYAHFLARLGCCARPRGKSFSENCAPARINTYILPYRITATRSLAKETRGEPSESHDDSKMFQHNFRCVRCSVNSIHHRRVRINSVSAQSAHHLCQRAREDCSLVDAHATRYGSPNKLVNLCV